MFGPTSRVRSALEPMIAVDRSVDLWKCSDSWYGSFHRSARVLDAEVQWWVVGRRWRGVDARLDAVRRTVEREDSYIEQW